MAQLHSEELLNKKDFCQMSSTVPVQTITQKLSTVVTHLTITGPYLGH